MLAMRIGQEVCGDSPIKNHIVWDEATTPLDLLAASVLLYIKREESCSPPPASSPRSSPIQKRKQYIDCDDFSDEGSRSPLLGDVQSPKRFRRSSSEEDLSCASDEWINEPRRSNSRMTRSHSQEFDSDVEYEHHAAGEEEEDEYTLEDDDDEWSDGRLANLNNLSSPISRIPRKKAPSGTACEKHKRWKKRCPDDCPMRKSKSKKLKGPSAPMRSPRTVREVPSLKDEHLSLFQWSIDQMNTSPSSPSSSSEIERTYSSDSNMGSNDSELEYIKGMNHSKMRVKLTKSSSTDDVFSMMDTCESPKMSRQSPNTARKNANAKRNRGTRKYLPQACDRHKLLHAKCPANCPDRIKRDAEMNQSAEIAAL